MGRKTSIGVASLVMVSLFAGYLLGTHDARAPSRALAADDCQTFTETGHAICGVFLQYWRDHGALAQQGFPLSDPFDEISGVDGKTYRVQYFERAVFELHPENQPPNNVLLSLLGVEKFRTKYNGKQPTSMVSAPMFATVASTIAATVATAPAATTSVTATAAITPTVTTVMSRGVTATSAVNSGSGTAVGGLVGQSVTYKDYNDGPFRATVTDAKLGISFAGAKPAGVFLVVFFHVVNMGTTASSPGSYRLLIADSKNRQFAQPDDSTAQYAAEDVYKVRSRSQTIQPSLSGDIVLVYDIAPDATGLRLTARKDS